MLFSVCDQSPLWLLDCSGCMWRTKEEDVLSSWVGVPPLVRSWCPYACCFSLLTPCLSCSGCALIVFSFFPWRRLAQVCRSRYTSSFNSRLLSLFSAWALPSQFQVQFPKKGAFPLINSYQFWPLKAKTRACRQLAGARGAYSSFGSRVKRMSPARSHGITPRRLEPLLQPIVLEVEKVFWGGNLKLFNST